MHRGRCLAVSEVGRPILTCVGTQGEKKGRKQTGDTAGTKGTCHRDTCRPGMGGHLAQDCAGGACGLPGELGDLIWGCLAGGTVTPPDLPSGSEPGGRAAVVSGSDCPPRRQGNRSGPLEAQPGIPRTVVGAAVLPCLGPGATSAGLHCLPCWPQTGPASPPRCRQSPHFPLCSGFASAGIWEQDPPPHPRTPRPCEEGA